MDGLLSRLGREEGRHLVRVTAELTHRCGFECPHCYCRLPASSPRAAGEMTGAEWERVLSEAADEGALFVLVTGGEPLLHADFRRIWTAAKRAGLIPELFTNGSLLSDDVAGFLADWPPSQVSVTLYGATEETYEAMTGRSGMLGRVLRGLESLSKRGVAVEVKGLFTRRNAHEFDRILELCSGFGPRFRWDADLVGPSASGHGRPDEVRLDGREIVELEARDPKRREGLERLLRAGRPAPPRTGSPFRCRVGQREMHVDPYGLAQPCMMLETSGYDLRHGTVREAWEVAIPRLLSGIPSTGGPCQTCDLAEACRVCPPRALRRGVAAGWPVPESCDLGRARAEAFRESSPAEGEGR